MKSKLKLNQEREALDRERIAESLRRGSVPHKTAQAVDPTHIGLRLAEQHASRVINSPQSFNRSLKTRDTDRIRLAYALHMFARYPVPKRLQTVWLTDPGSPAEQGGRLRRQRGPLNPTSHMQERFDCFFAVASGQSAYKTVMKEFLSKKEVHRLLTCRFDLDYYRAMFWSIARTFTDDDGVALRIAQSKIGWEDYHSSFWRDAVRFFAANPLPLNQINDLVDHIKEARTRNPDYTLKGRSLASLTTQMKVWHRELRLIKQIGHHKWDGLAVPDWIMGDPKSEQWQVTQILNGKELAKEGAEMHHCVYSYRYQCGTGRIGIFSLTHRHKGAAEFKRALTIEVDENANVTQVRGYANRLATGEENDVLRQWKAEFNLRGSGW